MNLITNITLSLMIFAVAIMVVATENVAFKILLVGYSLGMLTAKFIAFFLRDHEKTKDET